MNPPHTIIRLRATLLSVRDLLATAGPVALLVVALLALAYWFLNPMPPNHMVLATGPAQGAYAAFGERYAAELKANGIRVTLRTTQGSAQNLALLRKDEVDAAFVQGGAEEYKPGEQPDDHDLLSLGSLFLEPVWIFYHADMARARTGAEDIQSLSQFGDWSVNIGAAGSGVSNLSTRLFEASGLDTRKMHFEHLEPTPAVVAFLDGKVDAMVFVSAPESPLVQMLLLTPGVKLFDFAQSEAYSRRVPTVTPVLLPRGVVDLARDMPPRDVHLVAPTAALLVPRATHPALQQLLVQAARRIHGDAGWFQRKGEFPKAIGGDFPLAPEAERFYRSGPPFLQRYLPFWMANLVDRMWVVLISIIAFVIPLTRVVPPLYEFRIRSRIFRWYAQLRHIEHRIDQAHDARAALLDELDSLDRRVEGITVPLSHADELYALRSHIQMVRRRVSAMQGGGAP